MTGAYELNSKPHLAPETQLAADGKTILHRFKVEAVIFAPDMDTALHRLRSANIYLDAGRITEDARVRKVPRSPTRGMPSPQPGELRPLHHLHDEIVRKWGSKISDEARPYVIALRYLGDIHDTYGDDPAAEIILKFLGNSKGWRGDDARRIKTQLREHLKGA